jgi:hypothetical protein
MKDRLIEITDALDSHNIDPDRAEEFKNAPGEWFLWDGSPGIDGTGRCSTEQNTLLNEWKKLV